jgi:hypothetical protein
MTRHALGSHNKWLTRILLQKFSHSLTMENKLLGIRQNSVITDRVPVYELTGYQFFHNYLLPHEALKGKTPSEICGRRLIENAKIRQGYKKGSLSIG